MQGDEVHAIWGAPLCHVEKCLRPEVEPVYEIADLLHAHRATDVLLSCLAHPRWDLVFQPKHAAYLKLIKP
jgi:hypothetical protein